MIFRLKKFCNCWFRQLALLIQNGTRLLRFSVYLSCEMLFVLCCLLFAWPHTSVTKNRRGTGCDDHRREEACSYLQKPNSYPIYCRGKYVMTLLQGPVFLPQILPKTPPTSYHIAVFTFALQTLLPVTQIHDMIFLKCNEVFTRWQWSVNKYTNRREIKTLFLTLSEL
jgi:hypothetical protein